MSAATTAYLAFIVVAGSAGSMIEICMVAGATGQAPPPRLADVPVRFRPDRHWKRARSASGRLNRVHKSVELSGVACVGKPPMSSVFISFSKLVSCA
jgi:hypothetical protein